MKAHKGAVQRLARLRCLLLQGCQLGLHHRDNGVPERIRTSDLALRRRLLYPAELPGLGCKTMHIVTKRETGGQSCVRSNLLFGLKKRRSIRGSDSLTAAARMTPERCCGIRSTIWVAPGRLVYIGTGAQLLH